MEMTLDEIKQGVANDNGYSSWGSLTPPWITRQEIAVYIDQVAKNYAQACCEAQNEKTIEFLQVLIDANMCSHAADDLIKEFIKGLNVEIITP